VDVIKKLKALILLGITTLSLSGCSKEEIDTFISSHYKIIEKCGLDIEMSQGYYLLKANELNILGTAPYKVIGEFNTLEEANNYLNSMINNESNSIPTEVIKGVIAGIVIGGALYLFVRYGRKKLMDKELALIKE
jgi:hypothetical protein